jgi:hypothetical protein
VNDNTEFPDPGLTLELRVWWIDLPPFFPEEPTLMNHSILVAHEIQQLIDADNGDELSPETLAAIEALEAEATLKIEGICRAVADENRLALSWHAEAQRAGAQAHRHEQCKDKLRDVLFSLLRALKTESYKTDIYRVNIQRSPARTTLRAGVEVGDLPPTYVRIKEEPDLKKILADHKLGTLPEDVQAKVNVEEGNYHVKIAPR